MRIKVFFLKNGVVVELLQQLRNLQTTHTQSNPSDRQKQRYILDIIYVGTYIRTIIRVYSTSTSFKVYTGLKFESKCSFYGVPGIFCELFTSPFIYSHLISRTFTAFPAILRCVKTLYRVPLEIRQKRALFP